MEYVKGESIVFYCFVLATMLKIEKEKSVFGS